MPQLKPSGPRVYRGDGFALPSVTTVLGALESREWANALILKNGRREMDRLRDDAATLGTKIHAAARDIALGRKTRDPDLAPYVKALEEFFALHVERVVATEVAMVSTRERVGGTADLICELTGGRGLAVVDFKSRKSGGVKPQDRAQTAAYALLAREQGHGIRKRVVVRLHTGEEKRGRWYARSCDDHAEDVEAFRAAVTWWWWRYGGRLKSGRVA